MVQKNAIKELRLERGLGQKELGKLLGVGQTTISAWEMGKNEPDYRSIRTMAEMFGVSTDYLMGYNTQILKGETTMKLSDWKDVLLLQEVEALEDFGYTVERYGDREISRDEVFETIVEWNGGLASAGHIKQIIGRVYGVKL